MSNLASEADIPQDYINSSLFAHFFSLDLFFNLLKIKAY